MEFRWAVRVPVLGHFVGHRGFRPTVIKFVWKNKPQLSKNGISFFRHCREMNFAPVVQW